MSDQAVEPIQLEDALLDHLAMPDSAIRIFRERIKPELVADDGVREALQFVLDYISRHAEPPNREIIATETGWTDLREPTVPVDYVIEKMRERYMKRELKKIMKQMGRSAADPAEALNIGFNEIVRIRSEVRSGEVETDTTRFDDVIQRLQERKERGAGLTFGFEEIDKELGGMYLNELYIGVGRPKQGKSWLYCVKPAVENLSKSISTAIFTLELSKEEMLDRIACQVAEISFTRFKHNLLQPAEVEMLEIARETLEASEAKIHILRPEFGSRTVPAMVEMAREYRDVQAVYIDQMSYVESTDPPSVAQWQQIQTTCRQLKEATKYWPIMVACQFNREADGFTEMANLSQIGLSDAIGQTADLLLGIWANKEMKTQNVIEYGVLAARALPGEPRWHIKNNLSTNSDYRVMNRL